MLLGMNPELQPVGRMDHGDSAASVDGLDHGDLQWTTLTVIEVCLPHVSVEQPGR